ncbi:putative cAMP receptor protein [Nitrospira sp. ND1]|jgi:CRP/FNR family cyclic AMP-dependent transcriptional regulator|nr:putative cAMP receptor protein [Nitrospira sp. ND1]
MPDYGAESCCPLRGSGHALQDAGTMRSSEGHMMYTAMNMTDHRQCVALSGCFRGKLCDQLMHRPGRSVGKGELVYGLGDSAQSVFFLRRGFVKLTSLTEDGRELILRLHQAGEVFGELCHCTGERREQAVAMEDSEIVELNFDEFVAHLQNNRPAFLLFLSNVAQQLSAAYDQIQTLSFSSTMERLVRTLGRLADEFGEPDGEWVRLTHYFRQDDLAQMIGARREVVSTLLNQLRDRGLINYARKDGLLLHRAGLEGFLGTAEKSPANLSDSGF